ncbi:MAG: glycosyltransferase [Candidatus Shapirobacteria bacterium]
MKPLFTVIIPIRVSNPYLEETLAALNHQTYKNFELIVVSDKVSGVVSPAQKRNFGAKKASGDYLAFLDDDSYPAPNWLEIAQAQFSKNPELAALCGPQLIPPADDWTRQATGLVVSSWFGSGGAGQYRNSQKPARFVTDYPSVNLIVKKTDFDAVSGFDTHHWPGEDTILCLNITHSLNKKILYHPDLIVFHHRRRAILDYLTQIGRYALHRGHFARLFPQTSLKIGYLCPTLFLAYLLMLLPFFLLTSFYIVFLPLALYLILCFFTFLIFLYSQPLLTSLLAIVTLISSHLYYGFLFPLGFLKSNLSFQPHALNPSTNHYQGG